MATKSYSSYEEAAADYTATFSALLAAPRAATGPTVRGAGAVAAEALIDHADSLAIVSARLVPLASDSLHTADLTVREGVSAQLLVQAAAELQLATELLQVQDGAPASGPVTRGASTTDLSGAIQALEKAMSAPVSQGLTPFLPVRRAGEAIPATPKEAADTLRQNATLATDAIVANVGEFGGDVAYDLVFNTPWAAVVQGAGLLRKDIADKLDQLREGAGVIFSRAVAVAVKTLLNVYDKILMMLGREVEDTTRKQVGDWLDQIKEDGKIDLFQTLVNKLYAVDDLKKDMDTWLQETGADQAAMVQVAGQVTNVRERFTVMLGRIKYAEDAIGLAKLLPLPQAIAIVAGLQCLLLAVTIGIGNGYIGYRELQALSMTKGVGEVVREGLGVA